MIIIMIGYLSFDIVHDIYTCWMLCYDLYLYWTPFRFNGVHNMIYDLRLVNERVHVMDYDHVFVCIHRYLGWTNILQIEILVDIREMHSREGILSQ